MRATSWLRVGLAVCSLLPVISGYAIRDNKAVVVKRGFIVTYIADKEAFESKLIKRQDEEGQQNTSEPVRTSATRSTPVPSSRSDPATRSDEENRSEPTSQASKTEDPTQTDLAPTVSGENQAVETSDVPDKNGLPYTPPLTPAFAFAGFLLLVCGLPYTLAGVRHKQIHIFLSTCLLASLGVSVLIIYVMNPPVSNALQGGYVAAIAITGMLFGGLAVIFPEVTEVLACLLGGFCLAQWFLVLKAGGLVQGGYQKIIFILCFSIGLFCLALHHTTRPYGMIFSIAFSGATTTVLGIDFFSRAGLKEFWLYVWGLNDNIFPLETNTFPLTRGIRVEIAAIVVITCFGIISQMKLWQVIKQKREHREEVRKQRQLDVEAMEAENGRRVEEAAHRDREVWEKQYGDKSHTTTTLVPEDQTVSPSASQKHLSRDSGLPQSTKTSTDGGSSKVVAADTIEMVGIQKVPSGQEAANATPGAEGQAPVPPHAREGETQATVPAQTETVPVPVETPAPTGPPEPKFFAPAVVIREKGDVEEPTAPGSSANNGVSGLTTVHTVIIDPNEQEDNDDASSLATFADSVHDDKRKSMPLSIASIQPMNEIQEFPHDDAASSVAGVLDDEEDERSEDELPLVGEDTGRRRSIISLKGRRNSLSSNKRMSIVSLVRKASQRSNKSNRPLSAQSQVPLSPQSPIEGPKEEKEQENAVDEKKKESTPNSPIEPPKVISRRQSLAPPSEGAAPEAAGEKAVSEKAGEAKTESRRGSVVGSVKQEEATAPGSPAKETASQPKSRKEAKAAPAVGPPAPLRHGSLQNIRPPSKIVKTYRVSEWAKHLDPADEPQYDDIEPLEITETVQEKAAPVHVMELQEGASSAKVPPPIQGLSRSDTYQSMQAGNMVSRTNTLTTIREAPVFVPNMQGQTMVMQVPTHVYQAQAPTSPMIPSSPQIPTVVVASPPPSRGGPPPPPAQMPITNQPIVESPTEDIEMSMQQRAVSPTPSQLPPMCETLLTKRESMLKATPNFSTVADNTSLYGQSITQPQPSFQNPSLPNASASTLSLNRRSASGASMVQQQRSSSGTTYAASMIGSAAPSSRIPSMEMQPGMIGGYSPYVAPISPVIPSSPMMPSIPVPHGAVETAPPQPQQPSPGDRRENMLKAWRESLMQDQVISARTHNSIQGRRNEMIQESAMQNMYGKQKEMERAMRDNMVEDRYRNRDMLSIHREAMKRMQDKAKGI
ncbi:hypothetical protein TWF788_003841 [Orbilia oligospora]|uniref:TM7S3/TM198-like domain-containing protein n=1 Tax=Orbilia oligospora TaxID=2813651 RepID=A0A7C8Q006_ORBOL|nr:hypothetical protein TWF788_003841 [Orbilia oligospora]